MSYREKKIVDTSTSIPLGRLARPSEISSYIKKLIKASQYDYHESEAFEVKQVILNQPLNRGSVRGTFINNPNQEILGGVVKPLMPNIVAVPVIGEHVVVIEYNGQHYYTSIINRKGSTNENSIPGASGDYIKNTKYGEKFKRKKVKPLEIGEGCILYEGRFGQSIHFDGHDNVPSIKIRTNIDESDVRAKCNKDVGLYITWIEKNDMVERIQYPLNWSAGHTAAHLACQSGAEELYMCGFDGSTYESVINNIYKGTKNYLSADSRGFNTINWDNQYRMIQRDFPNVKLYKVGTDLTYEELYNNIR